MRNAPPDPARHAFLSRVFSGRAPTLAQRLPARRERRRDRARRDPGQRPARGLRAPLQRALTDCALGGASRRRRRADLVTARPAPAQSRPTRHGAAWPAAPPARRPRTARRSRRSRARARRAGRAGPVATADTTGMPSVIPPAGSATSARSPGPARDPGTPEVATTMKPTIATRLATPPANIATSSGTIHAPSSPSATSGSVASACTSSPPASARRAPTRRSRAARASRPARCPRRARRTPRPRPAPSTRARPADRA